jgi:shikimate dehydrogenase
LHDGDPFPLGADAFHRGQKVYDLVYTTPVTPIMRAAQAAGAATQNGLGMLIHQGAASFTIWTGLQADLAAMRAALTTG